MIAVSDSSAYFLTFKSLSCTNLIILSTQSSKSIASVSLDAAYLNDFTIVALSNEFLDKKLLSTYVCISLEYRTNNLPIFSATIFLIYSSSFFECSTNKGNNLWRYNCKQLALCNIISLIVFMNRYFSYGSDLSTRANTLCKKNSGLPIEMLPKQIEEAVLISSSCFLN